MSPPVISDTLTAQGRFTGGLLLVWSFLLPLLPDLVGGISVITIVALVLAHRRQLVWRMPGWSSPLTWAMGFYLLHVLGMLWSSNIGFGFFDLQIKLPLLLIPIAFCFLPRMPVSSIAGMLVAFSTGCAVSVLWKAGAAYGRIAQGSALSPAQEIFSSAFSAPMHPSYLAMYLCAAIAIWYLTPAHTAFPRWASTLVFLLLVGGVVFCASKLGWLVLAVQLPLMLALRWKQRQVRWVLLGALFTAAGLSAALLAYSPYARDRLQDMMRAAGEEQHDAQANTSSTVRWHTWQAAIDLFKDHPLTGTGTGDIKDELMHLYEERGISYAIEHRLNAHSQYLQTVACLGLLGALCLVAFVLLPIAGAWHREPWVAMVFGILAANLVVESMLEVQAGTLFVGWLLFVHAMGFQDGPRMPVPASS